MNTCRLKVSGVTYGIQVFLFLFYLVAGYLLLMYDLDGILKMIMYSLYLQSQEVTQSQQEKQQQALIATTSTVRIRPITISNQIVQAHACMYCLSNLPFTSLS